MTENQYDYQIVLDGFDMENTAVSEALQRVMKLERTISEQNETLERNEKVLHNVYQAIDHVEEYLEKKLGHKPSKAEIKQQKESLAEIQGDQENLVNDAHDELAESVRERAELLSQLFAVPHYSHVEKSLLND